MIVNSVVNSDPLERIHEDLHDLIFQHLNGNDILNTSIVSSQWYTATSTSKAAMLQIQLKIIQPIQHVKTMFDVINNSFKQFQNVIFSCNYDETLINYCFKILCKNAKVIVNVEAIDMVLNNDLIQTIKLPHLRALSLRSFKPNHENELYSMFLAASTCLYSLKLDIHIDDKVIQCLMHNNNLTELEISQQTIEALFKKDITINVNFKLKKLRANINEMNQNVEVNFIKFLQSQASTLESLHLARVPAKVFPIIFNQMQLLQTFYFQSFTGSLTDLDIHKNTCIAILEIRHEYMLERIKPLIDATPNVQLLFVERISQHLLELLSKMKKLKRVNYMHETDFDFNNNYDNEFNMTLPDIIRHIEYFNE